MLYIFLDYMNCMDFNSLESIYFRKYYYIICQSFNGVFSGTWTAYRNKLFTRTVIFNIIFLKSQRTPLKFSFYNFCPCISFVSWKLIVFYNYFNRPKLICWVESSCSLNLRAESCSSKFIGTHYLIFFFNLCS
jgi:hypothetical protein